MSAVTMSERNEGGSSPPHPASETIKTVKTMARRNWAEMKAMNALLRCTGDNKERRYFSEPSEVSHGMTMEGVRPMRHYVSTKEAARRFEEREERRQGMYGRDVFRDCQVRRPGKMKVGNRASSEAAGTMGTQMTTRRFSGSYITVYCKSRKQY